MQLLSLRASAHSEGQPSINPKLKRNGRLSMLFGLSLLGIFLFPIYWMVVTSLKPATAIFAYPPELLPIHTSFAIWHQRIFSDTSILNYLLNSAIVSVGTLAFTLGLAAPAAYALARLPLRGKSIVLIVSLTSLIFPQIMLATPLFVLFGRLGLTDTYLGLIIANMTSTLPLALVMLRPFFLTIPRQLTDAALIDGCNRWQAFLWVIVPLTFPGLLTTGIFIFLLTWNDMVFALSLTSSDTLRPITAGLWHFMSSNPTQWNAVMALSTLAMLPPLLVFLFTQRTIIAGIAAEGAKE